MEVLIDVLYQARYLRQHRLILDLLGARGGHHTPSPSSEHSLSHAAQNVWITPSASIASVTGALWQLLKLVILTP